MYAANASLSALLNTHTIYIHMLVHLHTVPCFLSESLCPCEVVQERPQKRPESCRSIRHPL